nr:vacuolar protein sorting-associated protein 62 [Tanacetum cinerariifolium]
GGFATGTIGLGGLQVCQVSTFNKIWATNQGGPDNLGATFYEPSSIPEGFFLLGHYSQCNNKPLFGWVLAGKPDENDSSSLAMPTDYFLIWSSESQKIKQDNKGYIWLPMAPEGYKAVGYVVTASPEKPSLERIHCVRSDLTEVDPDGLNVYGSRPKDRVQAMGVSTGSFLVQNISGSADVSLPCCLKNTKSSLLAMPNLAQIEGLIQKYSPIIYFHPDEKYLPSSVKWYFQNGALLYKKGQESTPSPIEPDGSNLPQGGSDDGSYWLDLPNDDSAKGKVKKGDLDNANAYFHVKPMFGGTYTDIAIWVFYPFNGPARAKLEFINVSLGKIDQHVGDWEHLTLRVSNFDGSLKCLYFSEHSGGTMLDASQLEFEKENKPIAYASFNGHAFYSKPGLVLQGNGRNGIRNDTAKGKAVMDTGVRAEVIAAKYLTNVVVEPPWLNYTRKWGPKLSYDIANEIEKVKKVLPGKLEEAFQKVINGVPNEVLGEEDKDETHIWGDGGLCCSGGGVRVLSGWRCWGDNGDGVVVYEWFDQSGLVTWYISDEAKLDRYSGDVGMSKDMLGLEQPGELRRSWYVEGHATRRKLVYVDSEKEAPNKSMTKGFSDRFSLETTGTSDTRGETHFAGKVQKGLFKGKEPSRLRRSKRLENRSQTKARARRKKSKPKERRTEYQETSIDSEVYEGNKDPEDHLRIFSVAAEQEEWPMPIRCKMFRQTLGGAARNWKVSSPSKGYSPEQPEKWKSKKERCEEKISFLAIPRNSMTSEPIVLEGMIEGHQIQRIHVDRESSSEIMYEQCFRSFNTNIQSRLRRYKASLVGFSGETYHPLGLIDLWVTMGETRRNKSLNHSLHDQVSNGSGSHHNGNKQGIPMGMWADGKNDRLMGRHTMASAHGTNVKNTGTSTTVNKEKPWTKTWEQSLVQDVEETLRKLRRMNILIDPNESTFGVKEGKFLGYIITKEGIRADPKKIQATVRSPTPKDPNQIRSLSLKLTVISKFILKFSELMHPIREVLKEKEVEGPVMKRFCRQGEQLMIVRDANEAETFKLGVKLQADLTPTPRAWRLYLGREIIKEGGRKQNTINGTREEVKGRGHGCNDPIP